MYTQTNLDAFLCYKVQLSFFFQHKMRILSDYGNVKNYPNKNYPKYWDTFS